MTLDALGRCCRRSVVDEFRLATLVEVGGQRRGDGIVAETACDRAGSTYSIASNSCRVTCATKFGRSISAAIRALDVFGALGRSHRASSRSLTSAGNA